MLVSVFGFSAVMFLAMHMSQAAEQTPTDPTGQAAVGDAPPDTSPQYHLAYKFTLGQVVQGVTTHQARIARQFHEKEESTETATKTWKHFNVTEVGSDGSGTLELVIDKVHMTTKFDRHEQKTFRSDDPKTHSPGTGNIVDVIGKVTAKVTYSPSGKLLKVANPQGKLLTVDGRLPMEKQGFLVPFPEQPIAIGATWKDRYQLIVRNENRLKQKIQMQRTYTLTSVENGQAQIDFKTAVLTPVHDGEIRAQLIQREPSGTIMFDLDQGLIVSRKALLDRTVINAISKSSSMRAVSNLVETFTPLAKVAENAPEKGTDSAKTKN